MFYSLSIQSTTLTIGFTRSARTVGFVGQAREVCFLPKDLTNHIFPKLEGLAPVFYQSFNQRVVIVIMTTFCIRRKQN